MKIRCSKLALLLALLMIFSSISLTAFAETMNEESNNQEEPPVTDIQEVEKDEGAGVETGAGDEEDPDEEDNDGDSDDTEFKDDVNEGEEPEVIDFDTIEAFAGGSFSGEAIGSDALLFGENGDVPNYELDKFDTEYGEKDVIKFDEDKTIYYKDNNGNWHSFDVTGGSYYWLLDDVDLSTLTTTKPNLDPPALAPGCTEDRTVGISEENSSAHWGFDDSSNKTKLTADGTGSGNSIDLYDANGNKVGSTYNDKQQGINNITLKDLEGNEIGLIVHKNNDVLDVTLEEGFVLHVRVQTKDGYEYFTIVGGGGTHQLPADNKDVWLVFGVAPKEGEIYPIGWDPANPPENPPVVPPVVPPVTPPVTPPVGPPTGPPTPPSGPSEYIPGTVAAVTSDTIIPLVFEPEIIIEDEEVPLAEEPFVADEPEGEPDVVEIPDEEVPLSEMPQTGVKDSILMWALGLFVSVIVTTVMVCLIRRTRKV